MMGKTQNWQKRDLCNFLKQNMVSEGDKSNTEVEKQKPVQERKDC